MGVLRNIGNLFFEEDFGAKAALLIDADEMDRRERKYQARKIKQRSRDIKRKAALMELDDDLRKIGLICDWQGGRPYR